MIELESLCDCQLPAEVFDRQVAEAFDQFYQFLDNKLDKSLLTLWSCTMPNSDYERYMAGEPVQISLSDVAANFYEVRTFDRRTRAIEHYVVQEYTKEVIHEVNKSDETPQSGLGKRDWFNQLKELAETSPNRSEYDISVNNLIAQQSPQTPPSPQAIAQRRQPKKQERVGDIFRKYGGDRS